MKVLYRVAAVAIVALAGGVLTGCASTPGRKEALEPVQAFASSPDGRVLVVSTVGQEVAIFDLAPLRFRSLLTTEGAKSKPDLTDLSNVFRSPPVALSPDGKLAVVAGLGGSIVGWDLPSGMIRFRIATEARLADLAFFPDGQSFVTTGTSIRRLSAEDGSSINDAKAPAGSGITSVAISPDGASVFAGLSTGQIAQYDAVDLKLLRVFSAHASAVTGLAVSPDGTSLASTAGRFDPRLWSAKDASPLPARLAELGGVGESLERSSQNASGLMFFAWLVGTARGFQIVGAPTMGFPPTGAGLAFELASRQPSPYCGPRIAYSPDGRFIATTAHLSMLSGEFHLVLADLVERTARVIDGIYGCSVAFTGDGRFAIAGGLGAPQVWNAETGVRVEDGK